MVLFPSNFSLVPLDKTHERKGFSSGRSEVDHWLQSKARQSQDKNLTRTKVLANKTVIVGFYSLGLGQVNFDDLPTEISRKLPRTQLPIIKLAWLGVSSNYKGQGLGKRLLASALLDCYKIGEAVPFCAVLIDCLDETVKDFYRKFDFMDVPGHALKLALPWKLLKAMYDN